MRSNSKVRRATMAALVAAAVVMGAGQANAGVRQIGVDFGPWNHSSNGSPQSLKRPGRGATSLAGTLRLIFGRRFELDGLGGGAPAEVIQRMPAMREPRLY